MRQLAPRITQDPDIRHGRPVIEGTRVPVAGILGHLAAGDQVVDLAEEYGVTCEDIHACLAYAAELVGRKQQVR